MLSAENFIQHVKCSDDVLIIASWIMLGHRAVGSAFDSRFRGHKLESHFGHITVSNWQKHVHNTG